MPGTLLIGGQFELSAQIGNGAFGEVYECKHHKTVERYAAKLEKIQTKQKKPFLELEYKLYDLLAGKPGIPEVKYYGDFAEQKALVLQLLGKSLENLF